MESDKQKIQSLNWSAMVQATLHDNVNTNQMQKITDTGGAGLHKGFLFLYVRSSGHNRPIPL